MLTSKEFRKLNRILYELPEIIPKREIDKYQIIWKEKYNYRFPNNILLNEKSEILKEKQKIMKEKNGVRRWRKKLITRARVI